MQYLESEFQCSGLCSPISCYLFNNALNIELKPPSTDCFEKVATSIQSYVFFCTIPSGGCSFILLITMVFLYFLVNQALNDEETIKYLELQAGNIGQFK